MDDARTLLATHAPAVWRSITRLVGNGADAADAFQETFAAYLLVRRRGPVASPAAMLRRIATRRAVDVLRRRRRRGLPLSVDPPDAGASPADDAARRELAARLRDALGRVGRTQATVFCLTQLDGLTHAEAAAALGVTANHVGVLLHRVRVALRHELAAFAPEPNRGAR